jgi:hypothetical protein
MKVVIITPDKEITILNPNNMEVAFYDEHKQYKIVNPLDHFLVNVAARAYPESLIVKEIENGNDNNSSERTRIDNERIKGDQPPSF